MKASMILVAGSALVAVEAVKNNQKSSSALTKTLKTKMNPDRVAALLHETQQEWVDLALHEKADEAEKSMVESCASVAKGMVDGSDGEKDRVEEYFKEVCQVGGGKHPGSQGCENFAEGLLSFMTNDPEANRNSLDANGFCMKFWTEHMSTYVQQAEMARAAEVAAKQKAEEQKTLQQENMIKMQKEQAEKAKKRAEEATKRENEARLALAKAQVEAQKKKDEIKAADEKLKADKEKVAANKVVQTSPAKKLQEAKATGVSAKLSTVNADPLVNALKQKQEMVVKRTQASSSDNKSVKKKVEIDSTSGTMGLREIATYKAKNFISHFLAKKDSKVAAHTSMGKMADLFRKDSSAILSSDMKGAAIKKHHLKSHAMKVQHKKEQAKKVKAQHVIKTKVAKATGKRTAEEIKAAAKSTVSQKVAAIKARIAKKFADHKNVEKKEKK